MTIGVAIDQLLEVEQLRGESGKFPLDFFEETLMILVLLICSDIMHGLTEVFYSKMSRISFIPFTITTDGKKLFRPKLIGINMMKWARILF